MEEGSSNEELIEFPPIQWQSSYSRQSVEDFKAGVEREHRELRARLLRAREELADLDQQLAMVRERNAADIERFMTEAKLGLQDLEARHNERLREIEEKERTTLADIAGSESRASLSGPEPVLRSGLRTDADPEVEES